MKRARQLEFPSHGGRREGAGRPRGLRVSHAPRPRFGKPLPAHVTLRVAGHVWNLRSGRCFKALRRAFAASRGRFGLRLIEFAVLGNHLHLIVEADGTSSLSRGMQGLNIRIARALNRVMRRRGRVFADHYHERLLTTPSELVHAIGYVLGNAAHHYGTRQHSSARQKGEAGDPFSSAHARDLLAAPEGWLLRTGWHRAKRVPHWMRALRG